MSNPGFSDRAQEPFGDIPTERAGREGEISLRGLDVELSMAAIFRGIPDAQTLG